MTPVEWAGVAGSTVSAIAVLVGGPKAIRKGLAWLADRREKRLAAEQKAEQELLVAKQKSEEDLNKLRVQNATITELERIHTDAKREERTEAKLWDKLGEQESQMRAFGRRLTERDNTITDLRIAVAQQKQGLASCVQKHEECEERSNGQDAMISGLQEQVQRQDGVIDVLSKTMLNRADELKIPRAVRKTLSDPHGFKPVVEVAPVQQESQATTSPTPAASQTGLKRSDSRDSQKHLDLSSSPKKPLPPPPKKRSGKSDDDGSGE